MNHSSNGLEVLLCGHLQRSAALQPAVHYMGERAWSERYSCTAGAPMGERSQSKWTLESYQEAHGGRCGPPAHINNRLPTILYSVLNTALRSPTAGMFYNEARNVFVSYLWCLNNKGHAISSSVITTAAQPTYQTSPTSFCQGWCLPISWPPEYFNRANNNDQHSYSLCLTFRASLSSSHIWVNPVYINSTSHSKLDRQGQFCQLYPQTLMTYSGSLLVMAS